jgi:hypothetical protein
VLSQVQRVRLVLGLRSRFCRCHDRLHGFVALLACPEFPVPSLVRAVNHAIKTIEAKPAQLNTAVE